MNLNNNYNKINSYEKIKILLSNNIVIIFFLFLCIGGFFISDLSLPFFVNDLISRISRNSVVVLALIIPVIAGMGLNFAIVLGAMGAQFALIMATHWGLSGFTGILIVIFISIPINIVFGYITGKIFNKTKGKEMITGFILSFFALGIYLLILLVFVGTIIPMKNEEMVLSSGVGLRVSIDIKGLKNSLDNVYKIELYKFVFFIDIILIIYTIIKFAKLIKQKLYKNLINLYFYFIILFLIIIWCIKEFKNTSILGMQQVPLFSYFIIALFCLFIWFLQKTKLGQDLRTVGQDQNIALVSGINVDKVRIIAIIYSTVIAGIGQIMFIQNMGVFSTYGAQEQTGLFSVASILIGGASVTRANIGHALIGTILFHSLFIISPLAAQKLFGNAQVGEYFRVFLAYVVIGLALAMYGWKKHLEQKKALEELK